MTMTILKVWVVKDVSFGADLKGAIRRSNNVTIEGYFDEVLVRCYNDSWRGVEILLGWVPEVSKELSVLCR